MRPVESASGGLTDLFVILPREFSPLPLQALRRGGAGAQRRFVAEQRSIHYLPSASSLLLATATPASQHAVTGIGHPGATGWDVEYELRDIRAFYKDAVLFFGQDATFEAMKRAGGDILHVTAELHYGRRSAGNSSLLLSDGKSSDGIRAIPWGLLPGLPPRAALLISDLGPHLPSKNPLLAQLLLMGGTRSVVLHAFTPLRKSRKTFGEIFYTTLLTGVAPDDAFHQAQLEMIRTSQPLHQWAAFSLWGK
jgi:CHAT domain-containing protein